MAKPFSEMPTSECLLSNALKLTSLDFHRKVYAMAETYGGIFKIKAPGKTVVVVTDPALLAQLTAQEFTGVSKPADLYETFAILCSTTTPPTYPLLALGNENDGQARWRTIRDGFAPAFAANAVPQYVPILAEEAGKVMRQVGAQTLDIFELVGRISLSATGHIMFGYDAFKCTDLDQPCDFLRTWTSHVTSSGTLDVSELAHAGPHWPHVSATGHIMLSYDSFKCTDLGQPCDFLRDIITARKGAVGAARSLLVKLQQQFCPFAHDVQDYNDSLKGVRKKYEEIYAEMEGAAAAAPVAAAAAAAGGPPTILQAFQSTRDYKYPDCPGSKMSKEDTVALIGNLVVAGTLPAATAAVYTLCLIATSPEVQAKVHAELDAAGLSSSSSSSSPREFAASDVGHLPYLEKVIKEAMRVNSAVPQVNRATAADIELGGYAVPQGTLLFLSMGGMHASPHNFLEPHRFYPERWALQQAGDAAAGNGAGAATWTGNSSDLAGSYAPFSSGIRACLGQHWARLAIMGTVASVLGRFKLASPRSMTVESLAAGETFSVSVYPRAPLLLTFTPRAAAG
ncbi:hypothetical protein OEZ85_000814 [Tetradesmus obliquus]|uniref:Cytochrome P450 n=1 Tax=Tetradesmus obliquus TaxID=3088 RepID=A0ABY8UPV0_TETOB|nr:hypothetical protein OEZ85_000814 [Tetradesmus obliquus]